VKAALLANAAIACAKLAAALLSGSATMLAEGVHSVADTANQILLLLGMQLSARKATAKHPFGLYGESYFWAFIVSLLLFFLGGGFAIHEGIHKLFHANERAGSLTVPLIVIGVSILLELGSFAVAFGEFKKNRRGRSIRETLFSGKDPVIPLVLLEDAGAVVGLSVALLFLLITAVSGSDTPDAIGSILIGLLLCTIGLVLAKHTRSLLIGEGIDAHSKSEVLRIATETPGVEAVTQLLSLHLGPEAVILALKVRFSADLPLPEVERVIDNLEARVRAEMPSMKRIFVEPDADYDATRDPEYFA